MSLPIRDPQAFAEVFADIERKAASFQSSYSAGKIAVEFNLKDGRWRVGNVTVTFPRPDQP